MLNFFRFGRMYSKIGRKIFLGPGNSANDASVVFGATEHFPNVTTTKMNCFILFGVMNFG
jgi:hypothetical protein